MENYSQDNKNSLLMWAAYMGYIEIVKYLIENGANIHIRNDHPLYLAAANDHLDITMYLVENGANVRASEALECNYCNKEIREYLIYRF